MPVGAIFSEKGGFEYLATVVYLLVGDRSSAKGGAIESKGMMAETAVSVESDSGNVEPEVVRMLVGLAVATGAIGALVLLS